VYITDIHRSVKVLLVKVHTSVQLKYRSQMNSDMTVNCCQCH